MKQPMGRVQRILDSQGPLLIIVPSHSDHELTVALRIAQDLHMFHRMQAEIAFDTDVERINSNNVLVIGVRNLWVKRILIQTASPVVSRNASLCLENRRITGRTKGKHLAHF